MERRAIHDEQHKGGTPRGAHATTDMKRRGAGREGREGREGGGRRREWQVHCGNSQSAFLG